MHPSRAFRAAWLTGLASSVLVSCDSTAPVPRPLQIEALPAQLAFDVLGGRTEVTLQVRTDQGVEVQNVSVTWTSAAISIATVDPLGSAGLVGVITSHAEGSTSITAHVTAPGFVPSTATIPVEVSPRVIDLLVVAGADQTGDAGRALAVPIRVRAVDRLATGVAGRTVVFEADPGAGAFLPPSAVTDANGEAESSWTLGTLAGGLQHATARVQGLGEGTATVDALAVAGPPESFEVTAGDDQVAVRGSMLTDPISVRVLDAFGNGVPGAVVDIEVVTGGGVVTPTQAVTDLSGALVATWTLGPQVGLQGLQFVVGAAAVEVHATATEPPAGLVVVAGDAQVAPVATPVPVPPAVRVVDASGAGVPGVAVTFAVTAGAGVVEPAVIVTGPDGVAAVASWTLGTMAGAGNQAVQASVPTLTPRVFTATATPGPAATIELSRGDAQTAAAATALPEPLEVVVRDGFGNRVVGAPVEFVAAQGFATPETVNSSAAGTASTVWTLGPDQGAQTLEARITGSGAASVTFTATAIGTGPLCLLEDPSPGLDLQLCFVTPVSPVALDAFTVAVARWEAIIIGDLPDVVPDPSHPSCAPGAPTVVGPLLDDLVIYVSVEPIVGGGLARAAPCFGLVRDEAAGGLPTFGRIQVNIAEVDPLAAEGHLVDVLVHEIGHVLGVGTLWGKFGLLQDPTVPPASADTYFNGPLAVAAFDAAGGATRTIGPKVPVENRGGGGSVNSHWRESVLGPELLTSSLNSGVANPLSAVTIQSLADLGYVVDVAAADPYVVPFPNLPVGAPAPARRSIDFGDDIWWDPFGMVDAGDGILTMQRQGTPAATTGGLRFEQP